MVVQEVAPVAPGEELHAPGGGLPVGLAKRPDGIYIDLSLSPLTLTAAINEVFHSHCYFAGLNYPVLNKALYSIGPEVGTPGKPGWARLADEVRVLAPERIALYKNPKLGRGYAEYYFETLYLDEMTLPDGTVIPERPTRLDVDEFVAEMWNKGILFGIEVAAVAAAIASTKADRITVATELEPEPGQDATVVEVSSDLHRSDAPKTKADGRVDLGSFQNRFPQIKANVRLLKKLPPVPGHPGYDLAGRMTPAAAPKDLTLRFFAGDGTEARELEDGEYLVSTREGFLNVDAKSNRISITDKIVSTDGVSGRTTGNLQLAGAYEEFGDVQEQRDVTGGDITVHGNVYGNIHSRGGTVVLDQNLVSGSIANAAGDITVTGVASGSVIHTAKGAVHIGRAENCVISGTIVTLVEASNCEIIAEEIRIEVAEGCAVAGRNVEIDSAGPRRRTEMVVYVLVKDVSQFDQEIADLEQRVAGFEAANVAAQQEAERIAAVPDVRRYLALAAKLRSQELQLNAEQGLLLRKIAGAVATELQAIAKLRTELQAGQTQQKLLQDKLARVIEQKAEAAGIARCGLRMVSGETMVRTMPFQADVAALTQLPAKDIKQRLRGSPSGEVLFCDSAGSLDWHLNARQRPVDA
ncbi:FapA family protein [Rugamonas sp. A1-17]|nr:FapA family protein [Rugamonas sp. A1-17]